MLNISDRAYMLRSWRYLTEVINVTWVHMFNIISSDSLSLFRHPSFSFILAGLVDCIQFLHRADICVLTGQVTLAHSCVGICEWTSLISWYFTNTALYVLFVLFGWFLRWEASARTAIASRICSNLFVGVQVVHPYSSTDAVTA